MLNPDFRDMLSAFCDEQVEFMVVGAYALAAHGLPRATGDIDLWIGRSDENARRVWLAIAKFGAPLSGLTLEDLKAPGTVFQIGLPPRRIDILTAIDGVEFDDAWPERIEVEIEGLKIPIIGRDHLLRNKKAAGRLKDKADVAWLESGEE
ncbi:MAG: hypothetical protein JMDDDDMK_05172 [Acidobacteria bacterium]|nr:hypothetical protein [Acidobacteriota bacterium]